MRKWCSGIIAASHAADRGSIPRLRSAVCSSVLQWRFLNHWLTCSIDLFCTIIATQHDLDSVCRNILNTNINTFTQRWGGVEIHPIYVRFVYIALAYLEQSQLHYMKHIIHNYTFNNGGPVQVCMRGSIIVMSQCALGHMCTCFAHQLARQSV